MSDKEKLVKLLTEFGIGFKDKGNTIECEKGLPKTVGYNGFVTEFNFDDQGNFIEMGIWE